MSNVIENKVLRTDYGFFAVLLLTVPFLILMLLLSLSDQANSSSVWVATKYVSIGGIIFFSLTAIFYIRRIILENRPENQITEDIVIKRKWILYVSWIRILSVPEFRIIPEGWLFGRRVSKEIYDAVNEGYKIRLTYYKFSKDIKQIEFI